MVYCFKVRLKPDEDKGFYYNLYSRSMQSLKRSNSNIALSRRQHNNNNDSDEGERLKAVTTAATNQQQEETGSEWVACAIKMLKEGHTDAELKDLVQEMTTMKQIGTHENIISLLGTFNTYITCSHNLKSLSSFNFCGKIS